MGFGLLFIGYFFMYIGAITPLSAYTYVVGAGIIIYSLKNLILENNMFKVSLISTILMEAISIIKIMIMLFGNVNGSFYNAINLTQGILAPIISILLVISIFIISKEVGLVKVQAKSIVDLIILGIYMISAIVFSVVNSDFAKERLFVINIITLLICTVFTLIIIFNCYAGICYEGDENMEKETGNSFFDSLNRILDKARNKNKKK